VCGIVVKAFNVRQVVRSLPRDGWFVNALASNGEGRHAAASSESESARTRPGTLHCVPSLTLKRMGAMSRELIV